MIDEDKTEYLFRTINICQDKDEDIKNKSTSTGKFAVPGPIIIT